MLFLPSDKILIFPENDKHCCQKTDICKLITKSPWFTFRLCELSQSNAFYSVCLSGKCKQFCLVQRKILFSFQVNERNLKSNYCTRSMGTNNLLLKDMDIQEICQNMHVHVHVQLQLASNEVIPISYNIHADSSKSGNLLKPLRLAIFSMQFVDKDSFLQNQQFQMISK